MIDRRYIVLDRPLTGHEPRKSDAPRVVTEACQVWTRSSMHTASYIKSVAADESGFERKNSPNAKMGYFHALVTLRLLRSLPPQSHTQSIVSILHKRSLQRSDPRSVGIGINVDRPELWSSSAPSLYYGRADALPSSRR
nr:hypothetical protein CFP56_69055 [Quercus suber]